MTELETLPKGWTIAKFEEILDIQGGSQPPKSKFLYEPKEGYIQLLQIRDFGKKPVPTFVPIKLATKFCKKDDVLIARYGASLGRIVTGLEGAYNVALAKVIDEHGVYNRRLLFYLLQTSLLQTPLKMLSRSAQNGFAKHEIANIEFPIIPISEQKRILAKLEQILTDLDKGIEYLETTKQQLKVYRRAVLKWAFEGKLTKSENSLNKWSASTIEEFADCLDNRRKPINKTERLKRKGEIPYYGANGITGWIDNYLFDEPLVLVVEDETFIGRELPFSYKITGKSWVNNHAHILKPKGENNIDFLNYQLAYYPFLPLTTGTTGRKKLTKAKLMSAPIRICSPVEQDKVVKEIESRLSVCDKIEETIEKSLHQAEAFRLSIIKKAFEGKLVPQDPNDEPAEKLLERIRAAKGNGKPEKKEKVKAEKKIKNKKVAV